MLQEINYLSDPIVLHIWASLHNYAYEEAIFAAERLFHETQHEEALFLLATCYFRKSLYQQTISLLLTKGCFLPKSKYLLAQSYWHLNQLKEVEYALLGSPYPFNKDSLKDTIVKEYGDQACYVLLLLGDVYRFSGQQPRAIECFKVCLQLNPLIWGAFERLCDLGVQEDVDPKTIFNLPSNAQLSVQTLHVASQSIFSQTLIPGMSNDRSAQLTQSHHSGSLQQPLIHPHSHRQVLSSNKIQSNSNSSLGVAERTHSTTNTNELNSGDNLFPTNRHAWSSPAPGQDNIVSRENQNPNEWIPFVSTSDHDIAMDSGSTNGSSTPVTLSPADTEQTNKGDIGQNSPIMTAIQAPNLPPYHQLLLTPAHFVGESGARTPDSPPRIYLSATAPKPIPDRKGAPQLYKSRTCVKGTRAGYSGTKDLNNHSPSHVPTFGMLSMHLHSPMFASVPVFSPNRSPLWNYQSSSITPAAATYVTPPNQYGIFMGSLEMATNSLMSARGQSFPLHRPSPTTSPSAFALESGNNAQMTMSPQPLAAGRVLRSSVRRSVVTGNNSNSSSNGGSSLAGMRPVQIRYSSVRRGMPSSSNNLLGNLRQTAPENVEESTVGMEMIDTTIGDAESVSSFKENNNMNSLGGVEGSVGPRTRSQVARAAMGNMPNHLSSSGSTSASPLLRTPPHYSTAGSDNEGNQAESQMTPTDADDLLLEAWEMRFQSLQMYLNLLRNLGTVYRSLTQYNSSNARDKMAYISPNQMSSALVTLWCARAFVEESQEERACLLLRDLHSREPWQTMGMDEYSAILWNLHKEVELSTLATEMLNLDRRNSHVPWCVAGNCMSLHRDHDLALRYFKRAVEVNPRYAIAFRLLGHEYKAKDEYEKALAAYREALHLDPRQIRALSGISEVLFLQERYAMAEFPLVEALSICPNSSFLWTHLGVIRAKLQRYHGPDGALACLERARELKKFNVICRYQYARILIRIGQYQKALRELEELRQLKPREPGVLSLLGNVHMKLGNHPQGMSYLAWAMEMDPKGAGGSTLNDALQLHCSLYTSQVQSGIGDTSLAETTELESNQSLLATEVGRLPSNTTVDAIDMDQDPPTDVPLLSGVAPSTPMPGYLDTTDMDVGTASFMDVGTAITLPLSSDPDQTT